MTTKTLDQQTARLIASMATCLPPLSSEVMQDWIDNPQGLKKYLSGLNPPERKEGRGWREEGGVIYFSVTSDGTTGEDWITRLESRDFRVGDYAKHVLRSPDFKPTNGVTTEVVVLKGAFFEDKYRFTTEIRATADERKLGTPNAELACLIREKFTDKEIQNMGLYYLAIMHEQVNGSDGDPLTLCGHRDVGGRCLHAVINRPDSRWGRDYGFVFVARGVSTP